MTSATKTTTTYRLTLGRLILLGIVAAILLTMLLRIAQGFLADPLNMLTGAVFGILAGVPAALLVLATSSRRRELERDEDERYERYHNGRERQLPAYPYQPPVIVAGGAPYYVPVPADEEGEEEVEQWHEPSKHEQAQMAAAAARTIAERLNAGDRDMQALDRIALDNYLYEAGSRILFLRDFNVAEETIRWWMGESEYTRGLRDVEHYQMWERIYSRR